MRIKNNILNDDCELDRQYWSREIFKINGRIDAARTLDEKEKYKMNLLKRWINILIIILNYSVFI